MTASKTAPARFEQPWHAELFAITLDLSDRGLFTWVEWTDAFGAQLREASAHGGPTDGTNYYDVWLEVLERLLEDRNVVTFEARQSVKEAWRNAYLTTPHGQQVELMPPSQK